ncbi:MAG: hypothetical protein KC589_00885 [Nanoarchaeota archaeon]|nr:hypothetical protein [Nanoarchaeota archaeon]
MTNQSSEELPLLTYNSLYNLLRGEKKLKSLQELPELFYEALEKFFEDKKNEIKRVKDNGDLDKLKREKHVYENSKKIAKELLSLRCVKISKIAIENQFFGDDVLPKTNILNSEEEFLICVQSGVKNVKMLEK